MERDIKSLLTIKVLRLVPPTLIGPPLPLSSDPGRDLMGPLWERELRADVTATQGIEHLSLGQFLRLPQGFGNMYLGETFKAYVVIQNESPVPVTNVAVRVDLQTTSQKFTLTESKPLPLLKTGETIDLLMTHEVKEMNKHMLICTLNYSVPSSSNPIEPIFLERFFKFQVRKPLDVKTKLYNSESPTSEVYLECLLQNTTAAPITLEKIDLEPSHAFTCVPMPAPSSEKDLLLRARMGIPPISLGQSLSSSSWPSTSLLLDSEASHQFLYKLVPKINGSQKVANIGKMDILWKTTMGSSGRLQTSQLQRQINTPNANNELKVTVDSVPDLCTVDEPFDVVCGIVNLTEDREMDLRLELEPNTLDGGYSWLGSTKRKIPILNPTSPSTSDDSNDNLANSNKYELTLSVFPLRTGLLNISGLKILDVKKGEKFCFNDLVQVFVRGRQSS